MAHKAVLVLAGTFIGRWMLQLVIDRDLGLSYVLNEGIALMVLWLTFATVSTALVSNRLRDIVIYAFAVAVALVTTTTVSELCPFR